MRLGQLGQHLRIDLILAERRLVPLQPQIAKPRRNVHGGPQIEPLALVNSTYHMMRPAARDHIYRRSRKPGRGHKIFPYLLRNITIDRMAAPKSSRWRS
jgi:hypothetical protein